MFYLHGELVDADVAVGVVDVLIVVGPCTIRYFKK